MGAPEGVFGVDERAVIHYPPVNRISRHPVEAVDWFAPEIDPTALVEAGTIIQYGDKRPTIIGPRVWLMTDVTISHDVQIGADSEVSHGARLGGYVTVGAQVKIGMGAIVLPRKTIGDGARIGAGAVVTKDVPAGETWVGNPAKPIQKRHDDTAAYDEWWGSRNTYRHVEGGWASTI